MNQSGSLTRQLIMTRIKMNGSMTADTLSRELGISAVAVRQHLAMLDAEGVVQAVAERRPLGRPVHRYALTRAGDETFERHYDTLASALLEEVRLARGDDEVERLFAARRVRLQEAYASRLQGRTLGEKLVVLRDILSDSGHMAELSDEPGCHRLRLHNCVIAQVARGFPCVCGQELALMRELLGDGARVDRETNIVRGDPACTYRVTAEPR